jgi:hypothetical protein
MTLAPDGVLIIWTETGFPHAAGSPDALNDAPGELTRIGRHAARLSIEDADRACRTLGGSRSVRAEIARDPRPSYETFDMTACLGPASQSAHTRAVLALLDSVSIGP